MTALVTHDSLTALQQRAVASSEDRDNWLAARALGCTATEVAKLAKGGAGARRELIEQKIKGDPFRGNQYTEWGKLREAAIAADVQARTAIAANDVLFHAAEDPRHLATPDGVGVAFDGSLQMSEIKTSKHDLAPGEVTADGTLILPTGHAAHSAGYFWSTGYYDQVQWQIYVTGAARARFTWEQHDDDWSGWPERGPKPLREELPWCWIERDDFRIDQLVAIADEFLDAYDVALRDAADGVAPEIDDEMDTLAVNLLRFREMESEGKRAKEKTWKDMTARAEGCDAFSQESALARVTWSPGVEETSDVPDIEAAKAADPDLFAEVQALSKRWNEHAAKFVKPETSVSKPTLTVTAIKQKDAAK